MATYGPGDPDRYTPEHLEEAAEELRRQATELDDTGDWQEATQRRFLARLDEEEAFVLRERRRVAWEQELAEYITAPSHCPATARYLARMAARYRQQPFVTHPERFAALRIARDLTA